METPEEEARKSIVYCLSRISAFINGIFYAPNAKKNVNLRQVVELLGFNEGGYLYF